MSKEAHRHNPAMRAHLRRFAMDHKLWRRFRAALETLEDGHDALAIATQELTQLSAEQVTQLKVVLRLLANGPQNEFRKLGE